MSPSIFHIVFQIAAVEPNRIENSFATAEDLITQIRIRVNELIADENQFDDITF
jgi:hypothetical protein